MIANPKGLKQPHLGPRQRAALRYIASRKTSPSRSEIGRHLGITRESAHLLVEKLIAQQYVERVRCGWRNISVTGLGREALMSKGGK